MALDLPTSLSPSKVSSFQDCALAFRFSAIDRLPEPPSAPAIKGTAVHAALERLFALPAPERTLPRARQLLAEVMAEMEHDEEFAALGLDDAERAAFAADAGTMVGRYFDLEDPASIEPVGLEMMLEAQLDGVTVRGIIDRLERGPAGELIVSDYKTGKAPTVTQERSRLGGVNFYAYLCRVVLGEMPAKVQLIYLGQDPQVIVAPISEQSVNALERKLGAVWAAIERACEHDDFRPKRSALCNWCAFTQWCPAFGGDPDEGAAHGAALRAEAAARAGGAPEGGPEASETAVAVELSPTAPGR